MANILTYLWTLLTDLPGALRHRAPARLRPNRAEGAVETRVRTPAARPHATQADEVILDAAGVERALAELMALFAQWQAGTLPPAPPPASRYVPHPSWQPVQLRRRPSAPEPPAAPAPPPALRPARPHPLSPVPQRPVPQRPIPQRPVPAPAPGPAAAPSPPHHVHAAPPRPRVHPPGTAPARPAFRPASPRAASPTRALPRPFQAPHRGQAPAPPTPILFRFQIIPIK